MPRHNRDDYEGDDIRDDYRDGPPPRKGGNTGLIVGLVVGALALGLLIVCGGGILLYTLGAKAGAKARQAQVVAAGGLPPAVDEQPARPDMGAQKGIPPESAKVPATPKKDKPVPTFSRKDFEAKVRGKSRDEITAAIGPPDETRERVPEFARITRPDGRDTGKQIAVYYDWWVFKDRVLNDATGKPYRSVAVRFGDNGKADRIEYP